MGTVSLTFSLSYVKSGSLYQLLSKILPTQTIRTYDVHIGWVNSVQRTKMVEAHFV